jgi:catechol 2,3-dioxygenase-like lactoylglutathione lyase family enzyme
MKNLVLVLACGVSSTISFAQNQSTARPRITGIDHVAFYTTNADGVKKLYTETLGLPSAEPVEPGETVRYMAGTQWVGYSSAPDPKATDRMDHVAFATDNIAALRRYLAQKGFKPAQIQNRSDHSLSFRLNDPEGHHLEFVERGKEGNEPEFLARGREGVMLIPPNSVSHRLIHAGFLVYNRPAEDHFYLEVLGFRPYWHGGMKDNETEWVSLQVPDGTDWLEYMLNQPQHPDLRLTGIMNHISLGVPDIKKAQAILESHGWRPHDDEKAQMGRDGKWQLNLYDPDLIRVELMEFKAVQKPCCSDFTAPHPTE